MTFEEMQQAAEDQRLAMQEMVDRELLAMAEAEVRHRRAIAEMLHALDAVGDRDVTRRLPDQGLPRTW